jgi:hypothetical protein
MSQVEEAIARLMQIRSRLAPITERLLDIEARLAAAKAADIDTARVHVEFVKSDRASFA